MAQAAAMTDPTRSPTLASPPPPAPASSGSPGSSSASGALHHQHSPHAPSPLHPLDSTDRRRAATSPQGSSNPARRLNSLSGTVDASRARSMSLNATMSPAGVGVGASSASSTRPRSGSTAVVGVPSPLARAASTASTGRRRKWTTSGSSSAFESPDLGAHAAASMPMALELGPSPTFGSSSGTAVGGRALLPPVGQGGGGGSSSSTPRRPVHWDMMRLHTRPQRQMSITAGMRPSIVTGGYESSSSESAEDATEQDSPAEDHGNDGNERDDDDDDGDGDDDDGDADSISLSFRPGQDGVERRRDHYLHRASPSKRLRTGNAAATGSSASSRVSSMPTSMSLHHPPPHHLQPPHSLQHPRLASFDFPSSSRPLPPSQSAAAGGSSTAGRRRAQSLMTPPPLDFAPSPTSPVASSRRSTRLRSGASPGGLVITSGGGNGAAGSGASGVAGIGASSPLSLSPRGNGSASPRFSISNDGIPASLHPRTISDAASVRSASMRSVRDAIRGGGTGGDDADSYHHSSHHRGDRGDRERDREREQRRKQKRAEAKAPNRLQASLGLGSAPREVVLTVDQIQDLLGDADVSSAIQLMQPKTGRRQSSSVSADLPVDPPRGVRNVSASPPQPAPAQQYNQQQQPTVPGSSSPPTFAQPYLVSAPPPLTNGDWHGRDRTASVSSSMGSTPQRNVTTMAPLRRRTSTLSTIGADEVAHVAFTHHLVPQAAGESAIEEEDMDDEYDHVKADAANGDDNDVGADDDVSTVRSPIVGSVESPVATLSQASTSQRSKNTDRSRRRISSMFGLGRKKRDPSPPPAAAQHLRTVSTPSRMPPKEKDTQHHQKITLEQQMKLAEQERREQELEQERRYRSLLQIHAHPAAQKRAEHVAMHLDSFYANINDSLVHPPKFNPLAVLRWVRRTEEQKAAKAKWEAQQAALAGGTPGPDGWPNRNSASSPPPWGLSSPRMSLDRASPYSGPYSRSMASAGDHPFAPGWQYTMDDVNAYNACAGKVKFWFPPAPAPEPLPSPFASPAGSPLTSVTDLHYRTSNGLGIGHGALSTGSASTSTSPHVARDQDLPQTVVGKDGLTVRISSPSLPSLVTSTGGGIDHVLLDDGPNSVAALSRQSSLDNGQRLHRTSGSFNMHRSHSSTSGIPAQHGKSLQALRAPFEKLSGVARRNITLPAPHVPNELDDDAPAIRPGWLSAESAVPPHNDNPLHSTAATHHHTSFTNSIREGRDRIRRGITTATTGQRHGLVATQDNNTTGTSEDEHTFRRLLGKGHRALGGGSSTGVVFGRTRDRSASISRAAEAQALEESIARQRQIRHTESTSRRPTELEIQTQERLRQVENDIYNERIQLLLNARQRTRDLDVTEQQMDYSLAHYLQQLDQVKTVFHTAADVDVEFTGLDDLRKPRKPNALPDDDESADSVAPLRHDSDRGGFSAGGNFSDHGRFSPIGNGLVGQRKPPGRKQSSMPPVALPSFAYGLQAWPKRSTLDPTLGVPVDPIRRVELSCDKARQTKRAMDKEREETTKRLQAMVGTVNDLIYQKDAVRRWTAKTLDEIGTLKNERTTVLLKIKGGLRPRIWRATDDATDLAVRWILSLFSYAIRVLRGVNWVRSVDAGWFAWALVGMMLAMLGFFYWVGSDAGGVGEAAGAAGAVISEAVSDVVGSVASGVTV